MYMAGKVSPAMRHYENYENKEVEWESDEDNSDASSSTKASGAGGSCSENESDFSKDPKQRSESTDDEGSDTESFCSAFETASEFGDDDCETFYEPQVRSCIFSVASLLKIRSKMLDQEGPASLLPKAGSLRCEARSSAASPVSRSLASSSTPKAWKPTRSKKGSEDSNEKVSRSARAILNKLTVEKFDVLYEQLLTCGIRTPEHVAILMREVFEKATVQHHFIPMYADLCVRLEPDPRILTALESVAVSERSGFRRLLLGQCQSAFEQLLQPEPHAPSLSEDEEMQARKKQRTLGNVKLVGELLVRGMLKSQLLCSCAEDLLRNWDKCPEAIESLAALLTVAAPSFDGADWCHRTRLAQIFTDISNLATGKTLPSRLRFMLKDVIELRDGGWQGRAKSGPVRLEEVRKQATTPSSAISRSPTSTPTSTSSGRFAMDPKAPACRESQQKSGSEALARLTQICTPKGRTDSGNFDVSSFHKLLSGLLRDLRVEHNATAALKKVRAQQVPTKYQAREFADLITRISEDMCGPSRRAGFAFLAGLCNCEDSAFEREECIKGTEAFFDEVYPDLRQEVQRLDKILTAELLPLLRTAWNPFFTLDKILPQDLRLKA
mmetsp:Transcript_32408/g.58931  ORF Transcript_32408/g.58931 Transcript_32408/m.58931 type:complete len:611 (-) Transcript_32408:63-1895(-)|eukprot:CAMPEP_0197625250 /NCGR_PEP_ID=MMETSP1338-20131121/4659_1 /TAXON_ID=43686 ORGANISM="Pelagodinium beii, Strain RCC1491" /NCGR_SAMPLE_ID=MMETSP1338 /ASSEMBLY_ACC=CAM_ASM_000754 /LENGTH=610 /DNA_ID=CAMNT_0043195605 /DNA_START=169 /DNA_END=2001 /DNA_ORIENTATION=+